MTPHEVWSWWQDTLDDLEPDTTTFTLTMSRIMAERTAAAVAYPDFPSDEDVEIAARALHVGLFADDLGEDVPSVQLKLARAALQAVADARRTEEEG